jgi:hypothetical protein
MEILQSGVWRLPGNARDRNGCAVLIGGSPSHDRGMEFTGRRLAYYQP